MESHFAKLNLDEEELIVMESCHSYIHDLLRQMGPTNAMDPRLQQEINNFPPEAKRVMQKCGGYRNFILRSKDLAVVDKIVAAKTDLRNAQELAFKEIYNSLPTVPVAKNENVNCEVSKDIWNSKPNILSHSKSSGNIWGSQGIEKSAFQDQLQLEMPRVDSLFNDQKGNSVYYQSSNSLANQNQDSEFSKNHGIIGNGGLKTGEPFSARQNLLKGLNMSDIFSSGNNFEVSSLQKQLEDYKDRNWKLTETNNELLKKLSENDQLHDELSGLQTKYSALEALQINTKNDYDFCKSELDICKSEMQRLKSEIPGNLGSSEIKSKLDTDRQIIFNLQKSLEAEQLRNLNLTKELENQRSLSGGSGANLTLKGGDSKPPGFYTAPPHNRGWDHSVTPLPLHTPLNMDSDLLGLRSMLSGDPVGGSVNSLSTTTTNINHSNSFLSSVSSSSQMFGGLIGTEFKPRQINKSASTNSLGLNTMTLLDSAPPRKPSPVEHLPPTSFPSMFSQPPPSTAPPASSTNPGKTARQEQLIKKLVGMLPGSEEETIKNCITALRVRHGKLSGWPTSKIASHIADLMKEGKQE
eukprot:GFUD01001634.1.p1 GENE.GFUD01001634.1~~GFUD01001634.1.p1  ORF type:complete len:652 (+),score=179.15 GFUD01001634.1:219-1958(+)